ncbi:hypothetical protein WKW80_35280 [Variovorax humicola]|uniref:Transposase IS204/IS1001/IS1096/IS1165 DDE domain-containing protein n=1 Tax=Variovorax humicola TaxID=1769758 RepID=A0ABU8WAW7_9BURK
MSARLHRFLSSSGIGAHERVTILCDAAGEFEKVVQRTGRPLCRIVDWFHIAMKFRAVEQTALKYPGLGTEWRDHHEGNQVGQVAGLAWQGCESSEAPATAS